MRLVAEDPIPFDDILPIYNWFYPLSNEPMTLPIEDPLSILSCITDTVTSRALYFHIPFCKSICTFCTFERSCNFDDSNLEEYTNAVIREIELKALHLSNAPVQAIFFGGGTPTTLNPSHIRRLGKAIRDHFDLSQLSEFSVEMALATLSDEKIMALQDIGVTHARFGVQSFNRIYREFFNLKTSIRDIEKWAMVLDSSFPFVSFDMLYGMDGQSDEEFIDDINKATSLGLRNIAYYPINTLSTQRCFHDKCSSNGRYPLSGLTKFYMRVLLREELATRGYYPHNGHEYVLDLTFDEIDRVVTDRYTFKYHKHVYGDAEHEVVGFGVSSISSLNRLVLHNTESTRQYVDSLLDAKHLQFKAGSHGREADASKGVILHLPYHGELRKDNIDWDLVFPDTISALEKLVDLELVEDRGDSYRLTKEGWYWYVNIIYSLCPRKEQMIIDNFIREQRKKRGRSVETSGLSPSS